MRRKISLATVLALVVIMAACAHRQGTNTPVSPWEQVMTTNAQIASANNALEQAVENAVTSGVLTPVQATPIITGQAKLAAIDYQITQILNQGQGVSTSQGLQLTNLFAQFKASGGYLVGSGVIGVKDAKTQQNVIADVNLSLSLLNTLETTLRSMGVIQ